MIDLQLLARVKGTLSASGDGGTASLAILEQLLVNLTNGTGLNQAKAIHIDDFSISGASDYDLAGSLEDRLGNAQVFTAVKAILVIASADNAGNVVVGGDANALAAGFGAAAHTFAVPPGGVFFVVNPTAAGWAVTASTGDILQLAPSSGTVNGTLVIVGEA